MKDTIVGGETTITNPVTGRPIHFVFDIDGNLIYDMNAGIISGAPSRRMSLIKMNPHLSNKKYQKYNTSANDMPFMWIRFEECKPLFPQMSRHNVIKLLVAVSYMSYDGVLVSGRSKAFGLKKLRTALLCSDRAFRDFWTEAHNAGLLTYNQKEHKIVVNRNYFCKGSVAKLLKEKDGWVVGKLFITPLRDLYANTDCHQRMILKTYFDLLPYCHKIDNSISLSPSDSNVSSCTVQDIADIFGKSKRWAGETLNKILEFRARPLITGDDNLFLKLLDVGTRNRKKYFVINTEIFQRFMTRTDRSLSDVFYFEDPICFPDKKDTESDNK